MKAAALAPLVCVLCAAAWAFAGDRPQPVVVSALGPKGVELRVATGNVLPCTSSSNTLLYAGPLAAGQELRLETPADCICVEHTFDDFPDKNWSAPETVCRPVVCTGAGRTRACRPAADATIRVSVASNG